MRREQIQGLHLLPVQSECDSDAETSSVESLEPIIKSKFSFSTTIPKHQPTRQNKHFPKQALYEEVKDETIRMLENRNKSDYRAWDRDVKSRKGLLVKKMEMELSMDQRLKNVDSSLLESKPQVSTIFSNQVLGLHSQYLSSSFNGQMEQSKQKKTSYSPEYSLTKLSLLNMNYEIQKICSPLHSTKISKVQKQNYFTLTYTRTSNPHLFNWISREKFALACFHRIYILDRNYFNPIHCHQMANGMCTTATSYHENRLGIGNEEGILSTYNIAEGRVTESRKVFKDQVECLAWKDENIVAASDNENKISLVDNRFKRSQSIIKIHCPGVDQLRWSSTNEYLSSNSEGNEALVWDVRNVKESLVQINTPSKVKAMEWIPHSNVLSVASESQLYFQQVTDSKASVIDLKSSISSFKFTPTHDRMISIHKGLKNNIQSWSLPEFWRVESLSDQSEQLINLILSKDGNQIATMSSERTITIWNLNGQEHEETSLLKAYSSDLRC